MVSGGGKEAKMKVGKRIEKTLRDGDGMHEGSDYIDEAIKVVRAIVYIFHSYYLLSCLCINMILKTCLNPEDRMTLSIHISCRLGFSLH